MQETVVDIWGDDDVLDTDQAARVLGPWPEDRSKTLLVLGHSGDGLVVLASSVAGRYVVSRADRKNSEKFPTIVEQAESVSVSPRRVPVGIFYAGPPCEWAQAEIAKVFGTGARTISHADVTDADREALDTWARVENGGPASIYIGCVDDQGPSFIGPLAYAVGRMGPLFGPVTVPTPEQVNEAICRLASNELAVLVVPPIPVAVAV